MLVCGWYDPFLPTQLNDYEHIKHSAPPAVASKTQLIIGPWTHASEITFADGSRSENFRMKTVALSLPWFDKNLQPALAPKQEASPVQIFVMGKNKWRSEHEWPLARTRYTPFYLSSTGNANGASGGGILLQSPCVSVEERDSFIDDPNNPVPTAGGAMLGRGAGMALQNDIESRKDVLVYTTPTLKDDVEITGPISLILYVCTSSVNTDFVGKLVDVYPDGRAFNLSDGIIRWQYDSRENKDVHQIQIQLWPTSNVFRKGHRIRLEVASTNFPRYDRNPNTGSDISTATILRVAHQTVYHNPRYPSRLILPIVSDSNHATETANARSQ
jgi:uncharacterized protein